MSERQNTDTSGGLDGGTTIRPLEAGDLDTVVAIDQALTGRSRRGFFERRLNAALKDPKGFIYVGACRGGLLRGYAMVRLLGGEFGQDASSMLDAIGVEPDAKGMGLGRALLSGVEDVMAHKGISELQTETEWTNSGLLGFLAHAGFQRAPRVVLKRDVASDLDY